MNHPRSITPLKTLVALLLAACLIAPTAGLQAAERKGAELQIDMKDGSTVTGELLQVKDGSLKILDASNKAYVVVTIDEIRSLRIVGRSKALVGAGVGLLSGILVGSAIGAIGPVDGFLVRTRGGQVKVGLVIGSFAGGTIGVIKGAVKAMDEVISCDAKTPKERAALVMTLEGHTRYATGGIVAPTIAAVPRGYVPTTEVVLPPTRPVSPTASVAQAGPAADTASAAAKARRVHVGLGLNYGGFEGVSSLKNLMRSVGFDHGNRSSYEGDYPRVADLEPPWFVWAFVVPDIRVDYSLNTKWAVGLAYSRVASGHVEGQELVPDMDYRTSPETYLVGTFSGDSVAATVSALFPLRETFLRKSAVRASVGIGVSRIKTSFRAGPYALSSSFNPTDPLDTHESMATAPTIVGRLDWIRFVGKTVSLNLGAQYRYIPVSLEPQTVSAAYWYYPASPFEGGSFTWGAASVAIPKRTMNAGGIGFGIGLGFHF
jgi:hypothetical protein